MDSISQSPPYEQVIGPKNGASKLGEGSVPDWPTVNQHKPLAPTASRTKNTWGPHEVP